MFGLLTSFVGVLLYLRAITVFTNTSHQAMHQLIGQPIEYTAALFLWTVASVLHAAAIFVVVPRYWGWLAVLPLAVTPISFRECGLYLSEDKSAELSCNHATDKCSLRAGYGPGARVKFAAHELRGLELIDYSDKRIGGLVHVGVSTFHRIGHTTKSKAHWQPLIEKVDRFVQKKDSRIDLYLDDEHWKTEPKQP